MPQSKVIRFDLWPKHENPAGGAAVVPYLDINGKDDPIDYLFLSGEDGRGLIVRANLQTIKGREKVGKSAAGLALIVAALKGEFLGIRPSKENLSILWIDTEQDKNTLRQKARAALELAGIDTQPDTLNIVPLRGYAEPERLALTRQAIQETAPDFVFLDGVVDLCEAFNDEEKSRKVVDELGKLAELHGCAITCLIHTNKKDNEARGHLGSIMQQKSAEIYEISKAGNVASIKIDRTRWPGVPEISFEFLDGFKIAPTQAESTAAGRKAAELRTLFSSLFNGRTERTHGELKTDYMQATGKGETAAKTAIADATACGILYKQGTGRDTRYSYLFPALSPDENEDDI